MRAHARFLLFLLSVLTLGGFQHSYAWDAAGHEIVATLAQIYLHPSVLPTICNLLNVDVSPNASTTEMRTRCHLALVATWADRQRKSMKWSASMHYVGAVGDYPRPSCLYPGNEGWDGFRAGNVLDATKNVTRILAEWSGVSEVQDGRDFGSLKVAKRVEDKNTFTWRELPFPGNKEQEALRFLVHFLGDMHQPLHLTGRDRGGNNIRVNFEGRETSLHRAWDSDIPDKLLRTVSKSYRKSLPDQASTVIPSTPVIEAALKGSPYRPLVRRILWEGISHRWESELQSWMVCPVPTSTGWSGLLDTMQEVLSLALAPPRAYYRRGGKVDIMPDGPLVCPYAWTKPIHDLNCQFVWPEELGFGDPSDVPLVELRTPEYFGVLKDGMVVEKLLAQGGLRLAGILNWLFAVEDGL